MPSSNSGKPTDRPHQARTVYSEFGNNTNPDALERAEPDLPPNQQNVRVQASRAGRKGKTVTIVTGFQTSPETLTALLKQLKAQCGSGGTLKDSTIEIQGDHKQKILQILVQLGYKAKISGG
jgi:translation initiation factor 1